MFENIKRGVYQIGDRTLYLRSQWEYEFACYLEFLVRQKQIKKWEYEIKEFKFEAIEKGTRFYKPDFKITNNDGTHEWGEVKGHLTGKAKTQIRRFKKYFPKEKLIVYDSEWFKSVRNKKQLWLPKSTPIFLGKSKTE